MKITVTQEHIDRGTPKTPTLCPIALACRDAGLVLPIVSSIEVLEVGQLHPRPLPYKAILWQREFDSGLDVIPFEFNLTF